MRWKIGDGEGRKIYINYQKPRMGFLIIKGKIPVKLFYFNFMGFRIVADTDFAVA